MVGKSKDKGKGDGSSNPSQKALQGLIDMGVPEDQARAVVQSTEDWLGQAQVGGKADASDNGDKLFEEASTKPLDVARDQARVDLVKILADTRMSDGIEKMAPTSEIPPPMIMRMVRALSLDEIISEGCTSMPATVVSLYFLLLMKANNRKGIKEMVQLFEMSEERGQTRDIFAKDELGG